MKRMIIYALAGALAVMVAVPAFAMGGMGGVTISGPIQVNGNGIGAGGLSGITPMSINAGHPGPEIHLTGKLLKSGEEPAPGHQLVRLRLDGRVVPMELVNTAQTTDDFRFMHNSEYARELQRAMFTKEVQVRGSRQDLTEMDRAAATATPLIVRGFVFSLTAPYLIVKSVQMLPKPAPASPAVNEPAR